MIGLFCRSARGTASWCETREASFLVRELNRLLAVQADAVVSAGGDVDKFIGDAVQCGFHVLAKDSATVFAMRAEVGTGHPAGESEAEGWRWPLGGQHSSLAGRAVVGSIGSDTRRDFTAIKMH